MNNRYKKVHILLVLAGFLLFGSSFCFSSNLVEWGYMDVDSKKITSYNFVTIAVGGYHSLALKSDGSIVGWDGNNYNQAAPPAGNDFIAIAAGGEHSLALKSDGSMVGWGNNDDGQATPPVGNDYTVIAAGDHHSLALKSDGSIVGWGANYEGEATPPTGNNYVAIAAGWYHSLALKSDGSIVGWGSNSYGLRTPPSGNNYVAIAAGLFHNLALRSDGSIVGWGSNEYGQATPPEGHDYIAIAAGGFYGLALKSDGSIVGWGRNNSGQTISPPGNSYVAIGAGYDHNLALRSDGSIIGWGSRVILSEDRDYIDISDGLSCRLALRADGSIVGWGRNTIGQATPPAGNNYVAIAAGDQHGLALKSDKGIVGWGDNRYGQSTPPTNKYYVAIAAGGDHSLGLNYFNGVDGWGNNDYGQITFPVPGFIGYISIAAGEDHTLALKSDGTIFGCGKNNYGQATPPAGNNYVAVAAGGDHSLALKSNGSIAGWGWNCAGQATPPAGNDYVAIAAGGRHSLALKSDGSIVGWGHNDYGQATPPAGHNYVAIAAGLYHSLALKNGLAVLMPNGAEIWNSGTTRSIQWKKFGYINMPEVKIEYSINNGQEWNYIDTAANTGSYNWLVPEVNSYQCLVRISDASDSSKSDTSNNLFTILNIISQVPNEYPSIWAAINEAHAGDKIIVATGRYRENINFGGKNIILTSIDPTDSSVVEATIIAGGGVDTTVRFSGAESSECELRGFTITGGSGPGLDGAGINGVNTLAGISYCYITGNTAANKGGGMKGVSGSISNCRIVGNTSGDLGGGLAGCMGTISNCIIAGNTAKNVGGGLNNCDGAIVNCTIANNSALAGGGVKDCDGAITNCIIWGNGSIAINNSTAPTYSCYPGASGGGNIASDPCLVDAANGDYHVRGDSPCIDAGDPSSDFSREPEPDGGRINMGAYGNTQEATSKGDLALAEYNLMGKNRIDRTLFDYVYKVRLANHGAEALCNIGLELLDASSNVTIMDPAVGFDMIEAGESAISGDSFTIRVDRSQAVNVATISWRANYEACPGGASATQVFTSNIVLESEDNPGGGQLAGDITGDGEVDLKDLARLAGQWLGAPVNPSADIAPEPGGDGVVNLRDFDALAESWEQ